MKKDFFEHNYIILLIYTLGLLHWLFFYFFVDYYSYRNIEPTSKIEIHQMNTQGLIPNSQLKITHNLYRINILPALVEKGDFKGDKTFFRNIISEKKINFFKLFKHEQFERNDWSKEHKYQNLIANSLRNFQMPFHVPNLPNIALSSDKFLGSVHYTLSPQIILLYYFNSGIFSILNLFLMFTFGFIGCLLIKNYFKLNSLSFFLLFIIFNFNGYWVEKYSNYGAGQLGYYCLPYVFYFLIRLSGIENRDTQREYYWSILTGLFLSLILLQGSLHLYVEMITFLIFWSIVNVKFWKASLLIYITTFSTSFMRLFPAMLSYGMGPNPHALEQGWGGYPLDLEMFISAFVSITKYFDYPGSAHEFSLYISMPGFLLLIYFGVWASLVNDPWRKFHQWKSFVIPCILISVISFHKIKFIILPNFIPLLNAESMTTRYMIIPLIFILIIAVINFQGFIEKFFSIAKIKFVSYFLVITTALFLFNHSRVWRNHRQENVQEWASIFDPTINEGMEGHIAIDLFVSNNYNDNLYIYSLYISLFLSIISTIVFVKLLLKFRQKNRTV